jgi:hypothetical protein
MEVKKAKSMMVPQEPAAAPVLTKELDKTERIQLHVR